MKKTMTRNIVIMAIVTVIMAVVLSLYIKNTGTVPAADNTASLADGTYTASEQGCLSEVAVTVTVTGGKVTNVPSTLPVRPRSWAVLPLRPWQMS